MEVAYLERGLCGSQTLLPTEALSLAKAQARLCLAPSYPLKAATEGGSLDSSLVWWW